MLGRMASRVRTAVPFALAGASIVALVVSVSLPIVTSSCGSTTPPPPGDSGPMLQPGDVCDAPQASTQRARFSPAQVFVPPCMGDAASCTTRDVTLILEPDVCTPTPYKLTSSSPDFPLPANGNF